MFCNHTPKELYDAGLRARQPMLSDKRVIVSAKGKGVDRMLQTHTKCPLCGGEWHDYHVQYLDEHEMAFYMPMPTVRADYNETELRLLAASVGMCKACEKDDHLACTGVAAPTRDPDFCDCAGPGHNKKMIGHGKADTKLDPHTAAAKAITGEAGKLKEQESLAKSQVTKRAMTQDDLNMPRPVGVLTTELNPNVDARSHLENPYTLMHGLADPNKEKS